VKTWKPLPVPEIADDYEGHYRAIRLNSLGSLYWFTKYTLGKDRLTTLHKYLCKSLEVEDLFLVMEVPMSHFKTTLGIGLSVWWALSFSERDEEAMRKLGYKDEWIRWMRIAHNQNTRTLITHEIAEQAAAIGKAVDEVYQNNDKFKMTFPELLPDKGCVWNNHKKFQKRVKGGDATTGTFEYRGVGQALQGIHVNSIIQDDNYGKEAQTNLLRGDGGITRDLIRWHKQLATRFDPMVKKNRRQLVIGNAWAHADLNAWIKKNQPEFKFETHDAEGGCCDLHPAGKAILPTEWSIAQLHKEKARLEAGEDGGEKGDYEHFYRNMHVLPGEQIFKPEWLRQFVFKQSRPDLPLTDLRNILLIEHKVYDGIALDDFQPGGLAFRMIVDPCHAKKTNRTEHIIWVVGYESESSRIYQLDLFSEDCSYSDLVAKLYRTAERWKLSDFWMGQTANEILAWYLAQRDRFEKNKLTVNEFPDDDTQAGMKNRIESLEPLFRDHKFWTHPSQKKFIEQYENYPAGALDTLDALGNLTTTLDIGDSKAAAKFMREQEEAFANRNGGDGGY
jgi:hypothetical protein